MSDGTKIEWTDATWTVTRGCSRVSSGCGGADGGGCYAERMAHRFSGPGMPYEGLTRLTKAGPRWTGDMRLVPEALDLPLHWRKPRRVFVNSMSDLFHEDVPDEFIEQVFAVMAVADRHVFQILTKRAERMRRFLDSTNFMRWACIEGAAQKLWQRNVWLGVSVENQAAADERIPHLLATPAAVRFLSCEPLLGPVRLPCVVPPHPGLHWVIVGGESGPKARLCDVAWIRSIVEQCRSAGVACFVKQDSGPKPGRQGRIPDDLWIKEFPRAS